MHELSLAQRLCDTVAAHVDSRHRVVSVVVELGPLCGVVPEALDYCFSIVAKICGFEGAKLDLVLLKTDAACPKCKTRFQIQSMWEACPACEHAPVTATGGRELRIKEVEVDEVKNV